MRRTTLSANLTSALPVLVNWVFGNYKDLISIRRLGIVEFLKSSGMVRPLGCRNSISSAESGFFCPPAHSQHNLPSWQYKNRWSLVHPKVGVNATDKFHKNYNVLVPDVIDKDAKLNEQQKWLWSSEEKTLFSSQIYCCTNANKGHGRSAGKLFPSLSLTFIFHCLLLVPPAIHPSIAAAEALCGESAVTVCPSSCGPSCLGQMGSSPSHPPSSMMSVRGPLNLKPLTTGPKAYNSRWAKTIWEKMFMEHSDRPTVWGL